MGGALALDFANSASGRGTPDVREHFNAPEDLAAWVAADARLADPHSPISPAAFRSARALRDAIFTAFDALAAGQDAPVSALALIAGEAGRARLTGRLTRTGEGQYVWDFSKADAAAGILGPIALSAEDLLVRADHRRIRACPGPDCGWLFYDTSKSGARRWCDMAVCGNRAKARAFRERGGFAAEEA